jgi:hypothetical protein
MRQTFRKDRCGEYVIVRKLAEGGFGEVFVG